jgi:Mg-chelatase subunit ChlD
MKRVSFAVLLCFAGTAFGQTAAGRLQNADKVHMLQSKDSSNRPFFRMRLTIPEGVPKLRTPANSIEIFEGDHSYHPFYVQLGQETRALPGAVSTSRRFALIVMDVSGSMLDRLASGQTKFEAATAAAKQFLNGFEAGIDNVAVVPFESRQVVAKIRRAVFASDLQSVMAEIEGLPTPDPKGNTGLYTAIESALAVLNEKKKEDISRSAMLLVLTDGKNDVNSNKGDDPGLLEGNEGLAKVISSARSSGFTVVTIGFGDTPGSIDADALRQIASPDHYWSAENLQSLEQIFRREKQALINQFDVTFATDWHDTRSLMGRDVRFRVRMRTDDGRTFESEPIAFATPETSEPRFEGLLSADEEQALIPQVSLTAKGPRVESFEDVLLSRLMIAAGLALALGVLWFGVPRLIWRESSANSRKIANVPSRPHIPDWIASIPRENIPARPEMPRPSEPFPTRASKAAPQPRRSLDDTIITGAQPADRTEPWTFDPPPDAPRKR